MGFGHKCCMDSYQCCSSGTVEGGVILLGLGRDGEDVEK